MKTIQEASAGRELVWAHPGWMKFEYELSVLVLFGWYLTVSYMNDAATSTRLKPGRWC